ncbi:prophage MuSo1, protein Gp32, putative [Shewanella sediminis HAW-EB3]|uniref:Prophage MuSo1, protein Gp32, putative n=1 Tax=Shewanella sediminis (strain HAW-EB3) TaxID=425104 RepID=A8FU32_SHESH|nr:prophage MuSo1, protein Gp32, putative [Shewanella sediminis HAW-EB3]
MQLLSYGEFAAKDGCPFEVPGGKWLMDTQTFAALKANTSHQTLI